MALVVSALAAIGIYSAFINTSQVFQQTKMQDNAWQQARSALTLMTQALEQAGYGLPMTQCAQIDVHNFQTGAGVLNLSPVSSIQPITASTYNPAVAPLNAGAMTYELETVTGSGPFGSAPATHLTKLPSTTAATMQVNNTSSLSSGDLFLITLPNATCVMGEITGPGAPGTSLAGTQTLNFDSGTNGGSTYNSSGGLIAVDPSLSVAQTNNAGFINLGLNHFSVDDFYISYDMTAPIPGNSVPSLYMNQYNYTNTPTGGQLIARGVVDMQVEFGYGTHGSVIAYGPPGGPLQGAPGVLPIPANVLAVKVALLVRGTRPMHGSLSPPVIPLMNGVSYVVPQALPATNTTGCIEGNCRHYMYYAFKTTIPVRNTIWGQ